MQRHQLESWHDRPLSELTAALHTNEVRGLTPHEAAVRLQQWGPNALRTGQAISPLALLVGQFRSLVIWVLIGAALVSVALGEVVDGSAILAIVLVNAVIGFFQEYRAERAVAALARLTAPRARVVRGGHADVIAASEVVRGDLLLLDAGDLTLVFALGLLRAMAPFELFLLGGNVGELTVMFIAALVGWPLPLLPMQLLWINLLTDGLPALALATDPIDSRCPDASATAPGDPTGRLDVLQAHCPDGLSHCQCRPWRLRAQVVPRR